MEGQKLLQLNEFDPFQQQSEHINKKQKTEKGWSKLVLSFATEVQDKKSKIRRIGIQHPSQKQLASSQRKQQQQRNPQQQQLQQKPNILKQQQIPLLFSASKPSPVFNQTAITNTQIQRQEKRLYVNIQEKEMQQIRTSQLQQNFPISNIKSQNLQSRDKLRLLDVNLESVQKRAKISQNCFISQKQSLKNGQTAKNVQVQNLRSKVSGQLDIHTKKKKIVQKPQSVPSIKNPTITPQQTTTKKPIAVQSIIPQKTVKECKLGKMQTKNISEFSIIPQNTAKEIRQSKVLSKNTSEVIILPQKPTKEIKQSKILNQNEMQKSVLPQKIAKDFKLNTNTAEKAIVPFQKSKVKSLIDTKKDQQVSKQKQIDMLNSRKSIQISYDNKIVQNQLKIVSEKTAKNQSNQYKTQYRQVAQNISQKLARTSPISNQSAVQYQARPDLQKKSVVDRISVFQGTNRTVEGVKRQVAFQSTQKIPKVGEIQGNQRKLISQQKCAEIPAQKGVAKQDTKKQVNMVFTEPFVEPQIQRCSKIQKTEKDVKNAVKIVSEQQIILSRKKLHVVKPSDQKVRIEKLNSKQTAQQVSSDKTQQILLQDLKQPKDDKQIIQKTLKRKREPNDQIQNFPQGRKQVLQRQRKRPVQQAESDDKQLCSGNSQDSDQTQLLAQKEKEQQTTNIILNQNIQIKHPVVIPSTLTDAIPKIEIGNFCPSLLNFALNREKDGQLCSETQVKLLKLLEKGMSRQVDEVDLYIKNRLSHSCVDIRFLKTRKGSFVLGVFSDDERVAHTVRPQPLPKFQQIDDGTFQWHAQEGWMLSFLTVQSVQKFKSLMMQWSERFLHQGGCIDVTTRHDEIPQLRVEKLKPVKTSVSFQRSKNYICSRFGSIFSEFHTPLYSLTDMDEMWLTRYNRCLQSVQDEQSNNSGVDQLKPPQKQLLDEAIFERLIDAFEYVCCSLGHIDPLPLQAVQEIIARFVQCQILVESLSDSVVKDIYMRWLKLREANDFRPLIPQYNRPVKHECDVVTSARHDFEFIEKIIQSGQNHCSMGSGTGSNDQLDYSREQQLNNIHTDIDNQAEGDRNSGSSRQSGVGAGVRVRLIGSGVEGQNSCKQIPSLF